jgi:3-oxoacyl-[acyl-carrier-protein] synthase-3
MLNEELAAAAINDALKQRGIGIDDVGMLAVGTTQGDLPVPGFASMVHGRLGGSPMEVLSAGGVCCSGMAAFKAAVLNVGAGDHDTAVAAGSELVSRIMKASRFVEITGSDGSTRTELNAEFLRWMLSDGAGAFVVQDAPRPDGLSLRVEWVHLISHANEHDTCMYTGARNNRDIKAGTTWLDAPTIAESDNNGLMNLRQDVRMLSDVVKLGVEEYVRLVKRGLINPDEIDHVLCHYSSDFFRGDIAKLMAETGLDIPEVKWFTNLHTKGNTGAASIFIMLEEAFNGGRFKEGEKVLLMVPESGRFSVAFALLTCVGPQDSGTVTTKVSDTIPRWKPTDVSMLEPRMQDEAAINSSPFGAISDQDGATDLQRRLMIDLALVWADFERMLRSLPIMKRLDRGEADIEDYKRLLVNLRQQVMEGSRWIARAASNISIELFPLRSAFIGHASDEHRDYQIIERDFCSVGGTMDEIVKQPKNIGSEALSAFIFERASHTDPLDLLGAMFIIEGLGKHKAAAWGEQFKEQLGLADDQVQFMLYHGSADDSHFGELKEILHSEYVTEEVAARIVKTARVTARLYVLQLEELDNI